MRALAMAGVAAAMLFGAWLRFHGLGIQVVQDDEWHAIHKLMSAGYGDIVRSFGISDHSIPLTMLYKAMADTIGLDEIDLRIVQVACGIALIGVAASFAWRATGQAMTTILYAVLVAGAPFLVLYSRFARPYAITTLLCVLVLAGLWRWRTRRTPALAAVLCAIAALSAWLHPLSALFPMAALAFLAVEDLRSPGAWRGRALRETLALAGAMGLAIAALLAVPMLNDFGALSEKAGHSVPNATTLFRVLSIFGGGLPDEGTAVVVLVAAFGAWRFLRDTGELGAYLVFVALAPVLAVLLLGASWTHQGHTFARYVFPAQLVLLFWFAYGAMAAVRMLAPATSAFALEAVCALGLAMGYLAFNPALTQVLTLGPWYGHLLHHYDYADPGNRAIAYYDRWTVPAFYRYLGTLPPRNITIIQAPFNFIAPFNPDAFYAPIHRQRELQGFVHDLCLTGARYGEVPRDPRFRFASFVFLDDAAAVRRSGARYVVFQRDLLHGRPFERSEACLEALRQRYGEPIVLEPRLAVFDIQLPGNRPTLQ